MTAVESALPGYVRDVEIIALSPRTELLAITRLALALVFGVWLYLANRPTTIGGASAGSQQAKNLLPFQALIADRSAAEQKMFRALQVAFIEAQNVRTASRVWPDVTAMAADGIDPFALDPTNRGPQYTWRLLRNGLSTNYLGVSSATGAPAWLLLVQEPDPAFPPERYQDDEEHAQLLDGTVLHVSIWQHANGSRVPVQAVRVPQAEGWTQLFAVGPSATH